MGIEAIAQSFTAAFSGRHVVVSGGTSGIGLAMAEGFAAAGAVVTATGSSQTKIDALTAAPARPGLSFARLDVQDSAAVDAFFQGLTQLDVLVNCQGVAKPGTEWEEADFLTVIDINLNSAMRLSRSALPLLLESRGNIINVASMLSYLADEAVPAYTASKTGIVGLTRAMAHRYGPQGVRVNAIAPGYHKTDMTRALWENSPSKEKIAERAALKRWGLAEDLVGPTLFLASPAAAFVTGIILPVDGGYHSG
ncbi:SDR family oxidoreductase [Acidisoma cellulosilytica]|uniref:SDR family oxidoreductase n=1 Tax=Acidisoma cellulosilyticum TaxID=2802395 RepID=A0A964E680_9PROT|nr:SDR family oxidoreductase [Acidisoma cellulosilyticum]MCB8883440.1 SDR family oxidoreductase [Acidisoma cellulosilyticum]